MEFILTDTDKNDIGPYAEDLDFESGDETTLNNFQIYSSTLKWGYWIYAPGTEWGGTVEYMSDRNNADASTWMGHTFRGLLMQDVIEPPAGEDYKTVSGEANAIIRELLSNVLGGFFHVPETDSGLTISSYRFSLYVKMGTGIMDMLSTYGYRLYIHAEKETAGEPFVVYAEAVPAEKISGEFNKDSSVPMEITVDYLGVNHLVCMGSGQLQARQRIDLHLQPDGSISTEQYYTGFEERTAYYDCANAQSLEDLEDNGRKQFKEIMQKTEFRLELPDGEYEIGDIISATHIESGLQIQKKIIGKILRRVDGVITVEHEMEGDE